MNLLNTIMGQLGPDTIDKLSGALGESSADTKSALGAAIPALMGQVANKAKSKDGANQLMNLVGDNDGSADFSSMLSNKDSLLKSGGGMLSGLMGNNSSGFSSMLSKFTGMGGGSMTSLLGMVAPLIMGTLGKAKSTMGLNASGLSSLLSEQSDSFQAAMPSGLADKMGSFGLGSLAGGVKGAAGKVGNVAGDVAGGAGNLAGKAGGAFKSGAGAVGGAVSGAGGALKSGAGAVGGAVGDVGKGAAGAVGDVAGAGGGLMKKLGPLLGIVLLALLALFGWKSCGGDDSNMADKVVNTTKSVTSKAADATKNAAGAVVDGAGKAVDATKGAAGKAVDATKGAAGKAVDATKNAANKAGNAVKKGASALGFSANSAEATLANSLSSGKAKIGNAIALKGVTFATGSANLENSSFKQLENIRKIMTNYPKLKVKLEGHTDNTGNADKNVTLSKARATAVMNYLVSKGVNKARLSSQGYGGGKPVASNKTTDGRKQNRRVEASIAGL